MDPVLLATARRLDPIRTALVELLDADPPAPAGFLVMGALALVILRGTVWQGRWDLAIYLSSDVAELLRHRRASANAAARGRQFSMRKAAYLDFRRRLLGIVLRIKRGGGKPWEPKTPASRQIGIEARTLSAIFSGKSRDQPEAMPVRGPADGWGAKPVRGKATDIRSGDRRAKTPFEEEL